MDIENRPLLEKENGTAKNKHRVPGVSFCQNMTSPPAIFGWSQALGRGFTGGQRTTVGSRFVQVSPPFLWTERRNKNGKMCRRANQAGKNPKILVILGFGRLTPKKTGVFGLFWVLGPPAIPGNWHSWELAFLGPPLIPWTPCHSWHSLSLLPPAWTEKPHKRGKTPKTRGVLGLTTLKNLAF